MNRPSLEKIFMGLAFAVSDRSECKRSVIYATSGSVIVSQDSRKIEGFGYNGRAAGEDEPCPGDDNGDGNCGCVHAEANAIANSRGDLRTCTIYCTCSPCAVCARLIVNCGITKVLYYHEYRDLRPKWMLEKRGILCLESLELTNPNTVPHL